MAIHVVQSQRIDVLLQYLMHRLQHTQSSALSVLQPQHFIVPSMAVETWLNQQLAQHCGISANQQFHQRIRGFQWAAYQWVLQDHKDEVRKANMPLLIMKWRIYQALKGYIQPLKNDLNAEHPLSALIQRIYESAAELDTQQAQLKKQSMLYWVADKVSRLFSNYMIYRGECSRNCPVAACRCQGNWLHTWGQKRHLPIQQLLQLPSVFEKDEQDQVQIDIESFHLSQAQSLERWQSWLWQELFHEDFLQMQRIDQRFWQVLGTATEPNKAVRLLPKQVVVFTLLDLPPSQLNFLRRLGQYIDICILHYNPSQEYWADMVDDKWKQRYDAQLRSRFLSQHPEANDQQIEKFVTQRAWLFDAQNRESNHPLLTRFGKQARDHFSLLANLASGTDGEQWDDLFIDIQPKHLLGKLQQDILYLAEPQPNDYVLDENDDSIQIHVCHSSSRQLEVLKDQLIAWLSQSTAAHPRRPSDILVLSPNLKELEPAIRSVFVAPPRDQQQPQRLSRDSMYLPIQIAGVSALDTHNAWQAVLGRMQWVTGRFSLEQCLDWLSLPACQQYYQLDSKAIERIAELLSQAGFKRGLDAAHLQQSLAAADQDYRYSFKFALDRLALGVAIAEHQVFEQTLSYAQVMPSDFALIGTLIQIYQDLNQRRDWMQAHELGQVIYVEQWLKRLIQDVQQFIDAGVESLKSIQKIIKKHDRMLTLANFYDDAKQQHLDRLNLPLAYVLKEIQTTLDAQLEQSQPTGHITFSQVGQIRPLPYQLIVMLNLDTGKFPRLDQQLAFDLMQMLKPQLGDRSRLEDDRGAFLDAVLLAQENLWLFYNGFDVNDGQMRDPSTVLQEFSQHLSYIVATPEGENTGQMLCKSGIEIPANLSAIYHIHALQPFDQQGFTAENNRFKDQWYKVAQYLQQDKQPYQTWSETPLAHAPATELNILQSQPWMRDVIFPAQAYLKAIGVKNISAEDQVPNFEPLLLDGLERYAVREFLLRQSHVGGAEVLLQDKLPVGKTQQATWQHSVLEHSQLLQRLHAYAEQVTPVTQRLLKLSPKLHLRISMPTHASESQWVSMLPSTARASRRTQIWLEYLCWLASLPDTAHAGYQRIVVCQDATVICQGVSASQAHRYLEAWLDLWHEAQTRPVLLPAALVLSSDGKKALKVLWNDETQTVDNPEALLGIWRNTFDHSGYGFATDESNQRHRDWQFIFQDRDAEQIAQLLQHDLQQYAGALYYPLCQHQQMEYPEL